MAVCASRFSVLKLDDDDISDKREKKITLGNKGSLPTEKNKQNGENKARSKRKKKHLNEVAELQSLAFGSSVGKSKNKSSSGNTQTSRNQWEEWKKKDTEFVSDVYEQDLQEAILLSKIDYEEKKDVYDAIQKESEQGKVMVRKKKKNVQKKEKGIMTLDEFQNLLPTQIDSGLHKSGAELEDIEISKPTPANEPDFFSKIEEESEKIINREQRQDHFKALEPLESARALQFQEELRKKDEEISSLNESLKKLKEEMKSVKSRNRKLYGILETGEMREKAEILVQIEQLLSVKDELNEQLKEYHIALEQERSKVHSLQMELRKCQNNKKNRTESK